MLAALLVVLLAVLGASRFWPAVERVEVSGAVHHDVEQVMRLARVAPGDPLLWITRWRVAGLTEDPWVRRARVTRHWPDTTGIPLSWGYSFPGLMPAVPATGLMRNAPGRRAYRAGSMA